MRSATSAQLPRHSQAFAAGQLSLDKVSAITRVATAADEQIWLELARQASGAQLARICREYRRATRADAPTQATAHLAARGLFTHWDDEGMLHLRAALPPDDGALVLAALESVAGPRPMASPTADDAPGCDAVADPAEDPGAARRADALVALCEQALAVRDVSPEATALATRRMVVHVDVGVLTGEDPEGRCHLEDGPALSAAAALRLGCDAEIVAVTERDGLPIDAGRSRRIVSTRLRRAVQARDRSCRFPGCAVPARRTHAHHIDHWAAGGRTELGNLVSLCGFHHRRLHDGAFRIRSGSGAGTYAFEAADGRPIGPDGRRAARVEGAVELLRRTTGARARIDATTPRAGDAGGPLDLDHTIWVTTHACELAQVRAGPQPGG